MVRTRFAPSPTGYLHIGGVRTALFNWLFARHHRGQFLLRIDDTDEQRNVDEALKPILEGFRWLGIDWDEGPEVGGPHAPYFQSKRIARYHRAVQQLIDSGAAYYDYATPAEFLAERELAEKQKRPFIYSRRWMGATESDRAALESEGRQAVVRLKMPREGELELKDLIRGSVQFAWQHEQDHVIQRTDGTCLYHLATVVDDHDFEITHVIRAEEHLSNTPRQIFIAQSLGYAVPQFAHIPYVAEPGSRTKLSKRKLAKYRKSRDFAALCELGESIARQIKVEVSDETFNPVIVDFYRRIGFLPDALNNYLLLLGWSLDDRTEYFTREEMIAKFSLERVNRAPASFDPQKLIAFQSEYMRQLPVKQKVARMLPFLQAAGWIAVPPPCDIADRLTQIIHGAGERIVVAGDILSYREFFVADEDLEFDEGAFDKRLIKPSEALELLAELRERLDELATFDVSSLESFIHDFVQLRGVTIGQIIHALRVAVTGKPIGFGLFETLAILGKDSVCRRIDLAIQRATRMLEAS